ncbi:hypothetical protein VDG1235_3538 [Verrucomicrobiia bacterium DG1235]|nr:hypothetical protein VDG1235_3538 [Verrucomicrobiae bacterium DG1235]
MLQRYRSQIDYFPNPTRLQHPQKKSCSPQAILSSADMSAKAMAKVEA